MITHEEIKKQCLKWWNDVLLAAIHSSPFFPREIRRIGKIQTKEILSNLPEYKKSIQLLRQFSKENKIIGYTVIWAEQEFKKIGKQTIPEKVIIETLEDYLRITGKEKEFTVFKNNFSLIMDALPELLAWIVKNPTALVKHATWNETLKVCSYFRKNPMPNLYIRQLPLEIHTKYISENESIIQSLLEFIIPQQVNAGEKKFEKRFHLKEAEPLLRMRFLDAAISPLLNVTDVSLPLSEFHRFKCECKNIVVAENLMNFLTLPLLPQTIALWSGGGFNVSYLKDIQWLKGKHFFYWGDIDAHGFQILNQFRSYFHNTIALMMDEETLQRFKEMIVEGKQAKNQSLPFLSETERQLYNYVVSNNIRLEQEKIFQWYAEKRLQNSILKTN